MSSDILEIMNTVDFKKSFAQYQIINKSSIEKLSDFLDNIDTNRMYYRIGVQKNKKYKKEVNNDTLIIKNINRLINKLTDANYSIIKQDIMMLITKEYILPLIIEQLIEKSILHHRYIPLYVGIIKEISYESKYRLIIKYCDKYFEQFFNSEICTDTGTFYEKLCSENKNIDNIIGFSILITYLEKENIINGYIDKVLDPFMEAISNVNDIEVFKMLVSFHSISELYYNEIPLKYKEKLIEIKGITSSSKIRFKVMDILGE